MRILSLFFCLVLAVGAWARAGETKLDLRDGDRVALVGSELTEHEQAGGYIETMLTTRFPDRNITFRNLGYSGDTVSGDARALCTGWSTFESPTQGLNRLKRIVQEVQPTVLLVNYGMNESFGGPAKLPEFVAGYNQLLDVLVASAKGADGSGPGVRQVVLLSPNYHEDLGRPLPDPAEHNRNLKAYSHAIEEIAAKRGYGFVDLYTITQEASKSGPLTSDGIHLTPYGYWRVAIALEQALGLPAGQWNVELSAAGQTADAKGTLVSDVQTVPDGISFRAVDATLPIPQVPDGTPKAIADRSQGVPGTERLLKVSGLKPGTYELKADDKTVARATAEQWAKGVQIDPGSEGEQAEKLRGLAIQKNFDFFNYWRPENDSYILSFRRHEQGKNAVELPEFKPIAQAKEAQIAKLRVPVTVTYSLVREKP